MDVRGGEAAQDAGVPFAEWLSFHRGAVLTTVSLAGTTALWVLGKIENGWPDDILPWRGACQLAILWALILMALSLMAGVRARAVEPFFGGLDRAVALHRVLGPLAILMLVVHLVLLVPVWQAQGQPAMRIVVPFRWGPPGVFDLFTVASWGFLALALLAYAKRLSYERWKGAHRLFGALFLVSAWPSLFIPGSISGFEPLRLWMASFVILATAALLYRLFVLGPRYRYVVDETVEHGRDAYDLLLRPTSRRMYYAPGMFVFVAAPGDPHFRHEAHPFSLSSSPATRRLRLSIRAVGDFTRALRQVPRGGPIDVYGPFGQLSTHSMSDRREIICIGAGIGISPFLGILSFDLTDDSSRRIRLFYLAPTPAAAVYDADIHAAIAQCAERGSEIDYTLWTDDTAGRFSAEAALAGITEPPSEIGVMLCGSAMFVKTITRQLMAAGVRREHIVGEGFAFR